MTAESMLDYCAICGAEVDTPVDTLTALAEAPEAIARAMRDAPSGERQGWSPAEVATHLADTEVVTGWRVRQILAEREPEIQPYDQEKWGRRFATVSATQTSHWSRSPQPVELTSRSCGCFQTPNGSAPTAFGSTGA